jgi:hypothetical protein
LLYKNSLEKIFKRKNEKCQLGLATAQWSCKNISGYKQAWQSKEMKSRDFKDCG